MAMPMALGKPARPTMVSTKPISPTHRRSAGNSVRRGDESAMSAWRNC